MHVRLINPFACVIARLDTNATEKTDGGKPGYDKTFREADVRTVNGKRITARAEHNYVRIQAQIEDRVWAMLRAYDNGMTPQTQIGIVADYQDLKRRELVDCDTGKVIFNVNDRLHAIEDKAGNVITVCPNPPGLFCLEVRPMSYGIGGTLNLVLLLFQDRNRGVKA